MKIKSITVDGYKNITKTRIEFDGITAIVSANNYGKSNLLEAIDFGTDFLTASSKDRKSMMGWIRGFPMNPETENVPFLFEIEFYDPLLADYCFVKYGYSFVWYRDDNSGQKIIDEWIETRQTESVKYTSYLKRTDGLYRKGKSTSAYRKINLDDGQLAIDVLASVDDIDINPVIKDIQKIDYHICSSLDLGDRFQAAPIEFVNAKEDGGISFDDEDVPKALYLLKEQYPDKYELFCEAVYSLFPDFTDISIAEYTQKKENIHFLELTNAEEGRTASEKPAPDPDIPSYRIKDEIYRIYITSIYLNQPMNVSSMSTGTKRIFWLLTNIFIAGCKGMCLIGVEELETSIHPKLLKNLLEVIDEALGNTAVIISSHSPFLIQYLKPDRIYVGKPNIKGTAAFRKIQSQKIKTLVGASRNRGMSVGEYLFDLMSGDTDSADILSSYLEEI